ncbi:MAG: hypothetical protein ACF8TS_09600, partial [Maioricimonas sp. JB049]
MRVTVLTAILLWELVSSHGYLTETVRAAEHGSAETLVEELGSRSFPLREESTRRLRDLGEQALPAQRSALKSRRHEVPLRAAPLNETNENTA